MTQPNDAYQKIAEMWTFPESESFSENASGSDDA